jgi:cytochrome c oxidase cbb3-type subunit 3
MTDDEAVEAPLTDHAYDGIHEYDNPLPSWWRIIFIGTIVFAAFYGLYFHVVGWGRTPDEQYRASLSSYDDRREVRERAELSQVTEELLSQRARIPELVAHGKEIFLGRCVSCHKADGSGLIGPNLTDDFQLHGHSRFDIFKTVRSGVPGTAMVAWVDQMSASDVMSVAVYAGTLRGQNLPGKAHEGRPVGRFAP